jgi:hypothetical protein
VENPPFDIERTTVEKVESFMFLGVHITDKLKWSTHTDSVVKKAQQCLFNLRRLKKFGLSPKTLTNLYRCTIVGLYPRLVRKLHRPQSQGSPEGSEVCTTHHRGQTTCHPGHLHHRKAKKIINDNTHPSHCLFTPLSSRRQGQYRCIKAGTERLKNSFYLKTIRLLNSRH